MIPDIKTLLRQMRMWHDKDPHVSLLMHVPSIGANYADILAEQMKALLSVCRETIAYKNEEWSAQTEPDGAAPYRLNETFWFQPDFTEKTLLFENFTEEKRELHRVCGYPDLPAAWQEVKGRLTRDPCAIYAKCSCESVYSSPLADTIRIKGTVRESPENVMPTIVNGAREVYMRIPGNLWRKIDEKRFADTVVHACQALGATYASIDAVAATSSVHESLYRRFGKESDKIDPETRLPGVYWGQFASFRRLENTLSKEALLNGAVPEEAAECTVHEGADGVWLQLSDDIFQPSVEIRRAFRRYFHASLYDLSPEALARGMITSHDERAIRMMPLYDEERKEVDRLRKQYRQEKK